MFSRKAFFLAGASLCVCLCGFSQVVTSAQNGSWSNPASWVGGVVPDWSNCTNVSVDHALMIDGDVSVSKVDVNGTLSILPTGNLTLRQRNGAGSLNILPAGQVAVYGTITGRDSITYASSATNLEFASGSTFRLAGGSRAAIPFASWNENSSFLISGFAGSGYIAIAYSNPWKQRFGHVIYDCPLQTAFVDLNGYLRDIAGNFTVRNTNGQALRLSTTQKSEIHIGGNFIVNGNSELWFNTTADSVRLYVSGNFEYRSQSTSPSYFATRGRCWVDIAGDFIMDSRGPLRFCSGSTDSTGVRRTTLRLHNNFTINTGTLIAPAPGRAIVLFDGPDQHVNTRSEHFNGTFDFHLRPGAVISMGEGAIANLTGNLFVKGHLKLGSPHAAGALQTVAAGNIQTKGARNYYAGATIEYNGTTKQYVGAGHPSQVGINFIAAAPELVLLQNIAVHKMEIASGVLNFASNQCNVKGDLQVSPGADVISGKVMLSGIGDQLISTNGISLTEFVVNNPASNIILNSPLRVAGVLEIRSQNTNLQSNGNLILTSSSDQPGGSACIASIPEGSMVSGDVTVQRFMQGEGRMYRYISSPVGDATVAGLMDDFTVTGNFLDPTPGKGRSPSLFYYNAGTTGAFGWNAYPASGLADANLLARGRGYAAFIREGGQSIAWDVTGQLNQGKVDLPVFFNPTASAHRGWNLVGNPYASSIDWSREDGWEKSSDLSTVFAIRDNAEGRFHYSDGQIGDLLQPHIASGQAFWVRTSAPSPFLRINESAKTTQDTEFFRSKAVDEVSYIRLTFSGKGAGDQTFLRQRKHSSRSYDRTDAGRMANDVASLSFVTADNIAVAINAIDSFALNEIFELKLEFAKRADGGFVILPRGEYLISLDQFGLLKFSEVFIVDRFLADTIALEQYHFSISDSPASFASDRFALMVKTQKPEPPMLSIQDVICYNRDLQIPVKPGLHGSFSLHVNDEVFMIDTTLVIIPARLIKKDQIIFLHGENISETMLIDTIQLQVLPVVPKPVIVETVSCDPGPARIEVAAKGQSRFIWFTDELLQNVLLVSDSFFTTPSIDTAAVFYVATLDQFNCQSDAARVAIEVAFPDSLEIFLINSMLVSNIGEVDWYHDTFKETAQSIFPDSPGLYRAVAERQGCRQEATYLYEPSLLVEILPVPFTNVLTIKADPGGRFKEINVLNSNGSLVFHSGMADHSVTIDTSGFSQGIYFVQLYDGLKRSSFKVVK